MIQASSALHFKLCEYHMFLTTDR